MKDCCLYILSLIFLGILVWIVRNIIESQEKEKLENKHKKLEELKLQKEIDDLEIEINLQEILIKKKIKEFFNEDINELDIKEIYEKLKDKITPSKIDEVLNEFENLKCAQLYENKLEDIKNSLNFIKENQKIETILKEIEKLEKNKNEKKFLEEKKNAL